MLHEFVAKHHVSRAFESKYVGKIGAQGLKAAQFHGWLLAQQLHKTLLLIGGDDVVLHAYEVPGVASDEKSQMLQSAFVKNVGTKNTSPLFCAAYLQTPAVPRRLPVAQPRFPAPQDAAAKSRAAPEAGAGATGDSCPPVCAAGRR